MLGFVFASLSLESTTMKAQFELAVLLLSTIAFVGLLTLLAVRKNLLLTMRKLFALFRRPRLAAALLNAQIRIRGKARLAISVRLYGRIHLINKGDVELGRVVTLVGDTYPIEITCHKNARISIGNQTFVSQGSSISAYNHVRIGRQCLVGQHTLISDRNDTGAEFNDTLPPPAEIIIEDHVWIGSRAKIFPGVIIGQHSVIGADSVVTRDVPAYCLAVGNPARVVRRFVNVVELTTKQSSERQFV
jgi:acetyltransferase-like isoleucine patch superfamily enzyme